MARKYRISGTHYTVRRRMQPGHDWCFVSSTNNLQFACRIIQAGGRP
jgi:hypothetical protein